MMNKDIIREIAASQQYVISLYNLTDLMEIYDNRPDHVWPFPTPPYLYFETNPEHQRGTRFWASWSAVLECLEGENTRYNRENYEINWRCWKGIPTDQKREQRLWLNKQDESSANDTPVLSEAQTPLAVLRQEPGCASGRVGYCPKCGTVLLENYYNPRYCGVCGQAVKWGG